MVARESKVMKDLLVDKWQPDDDSPDDSENYDN